MNKLTNTTFTRWQFWPRGRIWCKIDQKISRYSPFKFSESAKLKAKIRATVYHSNVCSGCSVSDVMSWKSCLGSPALESCLGSPTLASVPAVLSWQSVLAFLICMSSSSCLVLLVPLGLSCSGFPVLAWLFCSKCPVLAALSWQRYASSPVRSVRSAFSVLVVLFWLSLLAESFRMSSCSPVLVVLFCCPLLFVLPWLSYFSSPVLALLLWQSLFRTLEVGVESSSLLARDVGEIWEGMLGIWNGEGWGGVEEGEFSSRVTWDQGGRDPITPRRVSK
jgi:hypothetical protein